MYFCWRSSWKVSCSFWARRRSRLVLGPEGRPRQVISFSLRSFSMMSMAMRTFRASYTRRLMFFSSYCASEPPGDPAAATMMTSAHQHGIALARAVLFWLYGPRQWPHNHLTWSVPMGAGHHEPLQPNNIKRLVTILLSMIPTVAFQGVCKSPRPISRSHKQCFAGCNDTKQSDGCRDGK